jgi:hypothetical protein
MAVTYYVALPFIRTEDGTAPVKRSRRDQAGRRNVARSRLCGGGRIQACRTIRTLASFRTRSY